MAERKDRPMPTVSPDALQRFGPRLAAIGPYELSVGRDGTEIEWERPAGLAAVGFRARVAFVIDTDAGRLDPDERMFALWDRFLAGAERHAAVFRRAMVAVYRADQPHLIEQDEFPPGLTDAEVLERVRGTITVKRHEEDGEVSYWLDVSFAAGWDGEHAWDFDYDEATDSFAGPSRG